MIAANRVRTKLDVANTKNAIPYLHHISTITQLSIKTQFPITFYVNINSSYQFFFSGKFCAVSIKPNRTESKEKNKIDLLSNIMLEVTTNFVPARFSTARLLQKPIRLTIRPIKKHNSHFINMYWKTCTLLLPLQSCLNNSFSKILFNTQTNTKIFTISAIVFSFFQRRR